MFDGDGAYTVGIEEEVLLLDPLTGDLAPVAPQVLPLLGGDERFTLELPASQLEIVLPPEPDAAAAVAALAAARRDLAAGLGDRVRPAAAGAHPTAGPLGALSPGERYERTLREFGPLGRAQLVAALQVHVRVPGADRALAVHDALRAFLPELAALAANAAHWAGRDTGLASVRPKLSDLLPRQGIPPALGTWDAYAAALARLPDPGRWWWELRPHVAHGTLELRVPDAQTTVADAAGVIALARAVVVWLAERWDAGEVLPVPESWVVAENRWAACRAGVDGEFADVLTGERRPARAAVAALLDAVAPTAARLGDDLAPAHALLAAPGYERRRATAAEVGVGGLAPGLADAFLA